MSLGRPMVWFSNHVVAFGLFWPAAMIGFLLPSDPSQTQLQISAKFAGISLVLSVLTGVLTLKEIGSSLLPFLVALTTAVASFLASSCRQLPFRITLLSSLVSSVPCATMLFVMVKHIMEKIGLSGKGHAVFGFLIPDTVVGALNGFLALPLLLSISPLVTLNWTPSFKRRTLKYLTMWCMTVGVLSSLLFPYSVRHPKRVFLNHICRQQEETGCDYVWSVGSSDAIQVGAALPEVLRSQKSVTPGPIDWVSLAPFDRVVSAVAFEAPPFDETGPWGSVHPRLIMVNQTTDDQADTKRLEFELRWEKPGWGAMNMTGPVVNWSLSDPSGIKVCSLETDKRFYFWVLGGAQCDTVRSGRCRSCLAVLG